MAYQEVAFKCFVSYLSNRSQSVKICNVVSIPSILMYGVLQGSAISLALLKAQVSLQLGNVSSSDNGVSLSIMYSYTYIAYG